MKLVTVSCLLAIANAFMGAPVTFRKSTQVYLEDRLAEMIDQQLFRQNHHDEVEAMWKIKNAKYTKKILPEEFEFDDHMMEDVLSPRELKKDMKLAKKDPMAYCADRCLETGNCEIFEEIFEMGPEEVMKFCQDCVLSDGEEPCDVPESALENGLKKLTP